MTDRVMFSILVPVYNVEKYLKECLDVLVRQKTSSYEVILVDDGSTDDCGHICDQYRRQYPEIVKVIHQSNQGLVMARRKGIKNASGRYFVFVDSDDVVEDDLLSELEKIVIEFEPDMILYGATYYDGKNYLPFYKPLYPESTLITDKRVYYEATLKHTVSNGIWGKAVKRDIVDIDNDYSRFSKVTIGEDLLQSLPYITNAKRIYFLNECLYHYRINPNSMAHDFKSNRYESLRVVEEEVEKWARKWDLEGKDELIAYHAMKETVLNTLITYTKSKHRIFTAETKQLIKKIREDSFMRNQYEGVNKEMFNKVQNSLMRYTFGGGITMPSLCYLQ